MCVNYQAPNKDILDTIMGHFSSLDPGSWKTDVWQDYPAPIIRKGMDGAPEGMIATYGMTPKKRMPRNLRLTTMNARAETIGTLPTYKRAWRESHRCLVPMTAFFEPCYETGKNVWMGIGMADDAPFAVAGLWKEWDGETGLEYSFTQITINADEHSLMKRMHKPDDEKRSLVIIPRKEWEDWLNCDDPEYARTFLRHHPAELMKAWPKPARPAKVEQLPLL